MVIVCKYWKVIPTKFLVVPLIMRVIQLLQDQKIIHAEFGNVNIISFFSHRRKKYCCCFFM